MFIQKDNNLNLALNLWNGKASEGLLWTLDPGRPIDDIVRQAGQENLVDFLQVNLGCLIWGTQASPFKEEYNGVNIKTTHCSDQVHREYLSDHGNLHESIKDGQIIEHKVTSRSELEVLIENLKNVKVEPDYEIFRRIEQADKGRWPILVSTRLASPVQHMIQHEMGVADFWYLIADCPELVEEAMELWQEKLCCMYEIMSDVPSDGFYQAENTSTTMISPDYYKKYSIGQMGQLASLSHKAGKRMLVHMCGLLHDLIPLIKETGMDGIHALSPPPTGNTQFEYAYENMKDDCFILGRFGSLEWVGKSKNEIMLNLEKILPHHIYKEKPFALLATLDTAEVMLDNIYLLRDCINEYDQSVN